jgi:F0F1-type ATP synthase delta subunit
MRYTLSQYARALADLICLDKNDAKKTAVNFARLLQKNNDSRLASQIFKMAEGMERKMKGREKIKIITAKNSAGFEAKKILEKNYDAEITVRPEVLGGVILETDDWRIDNSISAKIKF